MANDILIVDDEEDIRSLISDVLGDQGIQTREAWDSDSVYNEIQKILGRNYFFSFINHIIKIYLFFSKIILIFLKMI